MYVCMCVCVYACMCICMHACMYVRCMYVFMHMCIHINIHIRKLSSSVFKLTAADNLDLSRVCGNPPPKKKHDNRGTFDSDKTNIGSKTYP